MIFRRVHTPDDLDVVPTGYRVTPADIAERDFDDLEKRIAGVRDIEPPAEPEAVAEPAKAVTVDPSPKPRHSSGVFVYDQDADPAEIAAATPTGGHFSRPRALILTIRPMVNA
jgi:hypothetical protein